VTSTPPERPERQSPRQEHDAQRSSTNHHGADGQHGEYIYTPNPDAATSGTFREAASWQLTAELVSRYPDRFMVIETHPAGGMYDCITGSLRCHG
jgi:hypothetical protein